MLRRVAVRGDVSGPSNSERGRGVKVTPLFKGPVLRRRGPGGDITGPANRASSGQETATSFGVTASVVLARTSPVVRSTACTFFAAGSVT